MSTASTTAVSAFPSRCAARSSSPRAMSGATCGAARSFVASPASTSLRATAWSSLVHVGRAMFGRSFSPSLTRAYQRPALK
ncbi:hypothetical protein [Sorangium sp. So ce145]|uniref:hypothetical protein n=1 Tax=Sorangium sp. So ce145 TaxID=3133285 RepID=UPI003F5DD54A